MSQEVTLYMPVTGNDLRSIFSLHNSEYKFLSHQTTAWWLPFLPIYRCSVWTLAQSIIYWSLCVKKWEKLMSVPNLIESCSARCTSWQYSGSPSTPPPPFGCKAMTVGSDVPWYRHHIDSPRQDFKEFTLRELWRIILLRNKDARSESSEQNGRKIIASELILGGDRDETNHLNGNLYWIENVCFSYVDITKLRQITF